MATTPKTARQTDHAETGGVPAFAMLLTVPEVASALRLSPSKIYQLIARGDLPAHRLPAIRISQQDLQEFLANRRRCSVPRSANSPMVRLKHLR